ncbi:MAG: transketolase [Thermoproteota archaeon]|nr:transketolase [Thermoproteota archaeon]
MIDEAKVKDLEAKAKQIRRDIMVQLVGAGGGHPGPSLSIVEICTALYFSHAKLDPKNPTWEDRDRIVLGKAHACETIYACLARRGYFSPEILPTYKHFGSILQGHADAWATVGLEYSGGSLGQGLGFALGLALAARIKTPYNVMRQAPDYKYRIFCICGDGETMEGDIWEAAMSASSYKLPNLINIVDYNQFSASMATSSGGQSVDLEPIVEKWRAFGWWVTEVDGHNIRQLLETLQMADNIPTKPKCIIAHTVKGKGIPYFEQTHVHMPDVSKELYDKVIDTVY